MALYAFDGTWNKDEVEDEADTNVVRFREVYAGADFEYVSGIGTRYGAIGWVIGGVLGIGGRSRIAEMYEALCENFAHGDSVIDIVGFSRGAALAVHFANLLATDGVPRSGGGKDLPRIRFLGLWDVVGSFGLSLDTVINFQEINLGWNIDRVADNVDCCFHALALDERRETFTPTRLDPEHRLPNVTEVWFRGTHGDIGGGCRNAARSNIALNWMLEQAIACGLPINHARLREPKYATTDPLAPITQSRDPQRDPRRRLLPGDAIHPSANPRTLAPGESERCRVLAAPLYNWSGVRLEQGARYRIEVPGEQRWSDGGIECGADGWTSEQLPWVQEKIVNAFESRRRLPAANWFELVGALGDEDDTLFRIGRGTEYTAAASADLYLFANDLRSRYANNAGDLTVTITRL